jgi:hypothetical protein
MGTESAAEPPEYRSINARERQLPVPEGSTMSYRSREAKRRKKAAIRAAKGEHRRSMDARYYRTKVKRPCQCSSCGCKLKMNADLVYRRAGPVTLCVPCADRDPLVEYRTSLRWEKAREQKRRKHSKPIIDANPHLQERKEANR